jgi:RNA polymerase sigma factor for flagellar operon FliA
MTTTTRARYAPRPEDTDSAILQRYGSIVDRIARRFAWRSGYAVTADDLWSAGALGLIDAARRFDPARDVRFETFAEHRVRGSIIDELRRMDHLPRRLRAEVERVMTVKSRLGQSLGREPSADEVAAAVGLEADEADGLVALSMPQLQVRADVRDPAETPTDRLEQAEIQAALAEAVGRLPGRLQTLLALHYQEELTYREIAQVLGVSQPRVCQLHAEAVATLRGLMEKG